MKSYLKLFLFALFAIGSLFLLPTYVLAVEYVQASLNIGVFGLGAIAVYQVFTFLGSDPTQERESLGDTYLYLEGIVLLVVLGLLVIPGSFVFAAFVLTGAFFSLCGYLRAVQNGRTKNSLEAIEKRFSEIVEKAIDEQRTANAAIALKRRSPEIYFGTAAQGDLN